MAEAQHFKFNAQPHHRLEIGDKVFHGGDEVWIDPEVAATIPLLSPVEEESDEDLGTDAQGDAQGDATTESTSEPDSQSVAAEGDSTAAQPASEGEGKATGQSSNWPTSGVN